MTITTGNAGSMSSEINVTPLIDVLLVLLIIFMVIIPVVPKGLSANVPQPSKDDGDNPQAVVVSVSRGTQAALEYRINQDSISKGNLLSRLTEIYANRADRTLFVRGDDEISFSQIAEVIDAGHAAGADRIGLITPKVAMGL